MQPIYVMPNICWQMLEHQRAAASTHFHSSWLAQWHWCSGQENVVYCNVSSKADLTLSSP